MLFKREKYHFEVFNTPIGAVIQWYLKNHFVSNLWYQRKQCWTDKERQDFLKSWFNDKDLGILIFYSRSYEERKENINKEYLEIIDGNNRIHCMIDYYNNKFPYIVDGKEYYFKDLDKNDGFYLEDKLIGIKQLSGEFQKLDDKQKVQLYLDFNMKGIPQSQEHLKELYKYVNGGV